MSPDITTCAALSDLNARFAWAVDRHDWAALAEILTPDVRYISVDRELHGRDAVLASFRQRPSGRTTRHGLGNLLLNGQADGTVLGLGSWHTFARNSDAVLGVPLYMVADFTDRYARDDNGTWRIAERRITPVFRDDALAPLPGTADQ